MFTITEVKLVPIETQMIAPASASIVASPASILKLRDPDTRKVAINEIMKQVPGLPSPETVEEVATWVDEFLGDASFFDKWVHHHLQAPRFTVSQDYAVLGVADHVTATLSLFDEDDVDYALDVLTYMSGKGHGDCQLLIVYKDASKDFDHLTMLARHRARFIQDHAGLNDSFSEVDAIFSQWVDSEVRAGTLSEPVAKVITHENCLINKERVHEANLFFSAHMMIGYMDQLQEAIEPVDNDTVRKLVRRAPAMSNLARCYGLSKDQTDAFAAKLASDYTAQTNSNPKSVTLVAEEAMKKLLKVWGITA